MFEITTLLVTLAWLITGFGCHVLDETDFFNDEKEIHWPIAALYSLLAFLPVLGLVIRVLSKLPNLKVPKLRGKK